MFVDVLNILACIAVVALHVSLNVFVPEPSHLWVKSVVMQGLGIFAVPIFFMISGMNLLGYHEKYSTAVFFKKRVLRVGQALVFGSIVCYLIFGLFPHSFYGAEAIGDSFSFLDFFARFLTNNINDTYWFFYTIIYLYMLTPILSRIVGNKKVMEYTMLLCFIIAILLPLLNHLGFNKKYYSTLFGWPLFASSALLFYMAGYYIKNYLNLHRIHPVVYAITYMISTLSMLALGLYDNGYLGSGHLASTYDNYWISTASPFCVIQATSLFLFFCRIEKQLSSINETVKNYIVQLSGLSLGVYLFHVAVINWWGVNMHLLEDKPILRLLAVYCITAVFVFIGKYIISLVKNAIRSLSATKKEGVAKCD